MSASLLSRTVRQPPRESIVLPFLYQTRTILRCYSDKSKRRSAYVPRHPERDSKRSSEPESSAGPRRKTDDRPLRTRNARPTRSREERPARARDNDGAPRRQQVAPRRRERVPDVPFEGPIPSNDPNVRLQGTTMTPKELAIFETLFRSKQKKPVESKESKEARSKAKNLAKVVPDFPAPLRALADEAKVLHSTAAGEAEEDTANSSSSLQTSEAAEKFLSSIKARMDKATNDVALWQIMTDEVFNPIKELNLEQPSASSPMDPDDVEALTRSLPNILLHFMSRMQSTFPGSSYGLVLLPALKKLGPAAFALGATTDLYNEHMQILYRQYTDLDSIAGILAEMDKEVYEFNSGTQGLLQSIFQRHRAATSGRMGPGMQALWTTDRKTRALAKLRRWDMAVQEQVRTAAMRKARDQEFQSEAEIGDEGEVEAYGNSRTYAAAA